MIYTVYKIEIEGIIRYIGFTDDIIRREKQHNYLCFKASKVKQLYNKIRENNNIDDYKIILKPIKEFRNKVEAKRYEALLILIDHFKDKNLWQQVPRISDR